MSNDKNAHVTTCVFFKFKAAFLKERTELHYLLFV